MIDAIKDRIRALEKRVKALEDAPDPEQAARKAAYAECARIANNYAFGGIGMAIAGQIEAAAVRVTEAGRAEMAKGGDKVRACPNCLGTGRWWNTVYQSYYDCPCNEMRAMVALAEMMKLFLSVRP